MIEIRKVFFSYFDNLVLKDISLKIGEGERVALVGPNGSGKSTLLKLCCGLLQPKEGEIRIDGRDIRQFRRKEIAQQIAMVPQHFHIPFAFKVEEVVMLGRTPFLRPFAEESKEHRQVIEEVMELIGISHLRGRFFNELSGGERQKVILSLALAQQPKVLLLDEPTAHLDIHHQIEILEVIRSLNQGGLTVLGAMHDLNLAALYFERIVMLKEGQIFAQGSPSEVLTEGTIREVYSAKVKIEPHPTKKAPHIILLP